MFLWTAFMIGLVGSLHCIGMCGPIALAIPYQANTKVQTLGNILLYNSGRIITYGLIGILPAIFGLALSLSGMQKNMSIVLGAMLIIAAAFSIPLDQRTHAIPGINKIYLWAATKMKSFISQKNKAAFFITGLLNGFLPCGMVYMAVMGAITQTSMANAFFYMILFGMGTVPLMLMIGVSGQFINLTWRRKLQSVIPVFMIGIGILMIMRGITIDLPPRLEPLIEMGLMPMCH